MISKKELSNMFKSAWIAGFTALANENPNQELSASELNAFAEEMANMFADSAFTSLDLDGNGELSFEEFREFAKAEPKITATLNGVKKDVGITFW
jgi:hypothetical protein